MGFYTAGNWSESQLTTSPDVKVNWLTASQMVELTDNSNVLGAASTNKNIYMRTDLTDSMLLSVAVHEFGHMLGIWSHSFDPMISCIPIWRHQV